MRVAARDPVSAPRPLPRTRYPLRAGLAMLLTTSGLCAPAFSAEDSTNNRALEELVVTATRLPGNAAEVPAALSRVEIDPLLGAQQGLDFTEYLRTVPGLFVQSRYNASQDLRIDLRGFGARGNFGIRGLRIFIDGIPAGLPDGQVQVDTLDPGQIKSIEVLRGPAAAQFGNGAGGVILIETRGPQAAPPWMLSASAGAHGFKSVAASTRTRDAGQPWVAGVNFSKLSLDGHRDQSRSDHRRLAADMRVALGDGDEIMLRASATDAPIAEDPGGLNLPDLLNDPSAAARNNLRFDAGETLDQQDLAWRWQRDNAARAPRLEISNYFTWRDFSNRLPFVNGGSVRIDRRVNGAAIQMRSRPESASSWITGLEINRQQDRRRRFDNNEGQTGQLRLDQLETVTASGAFAGIEWGPAALSAQAALRFDSLELALKDRLLIDGDDSGDRRFNRWSYGLGAQSRIRESVRSYLRFASSFDTPTTTELANPLGAGFNQSVSPQRSQAWEWGLEHTGEWARLGLAIYQVQTKDELVSFELASSPGRSFFENAGASRRRGAELSLDSPGTGRVTWRASAALADAVFTRFVSDGEDFAGRQIPGSPGLRIAAGLDWTQRPALRVGIDAAWVQDLYADNANQVRAPDYLEVGVRLAYGINLARTRVEYHAGIRNLLDERYADNVRINAFGGRYFEPAPGRYFYAGVSLQGRR